MQDPKDAIEHATVVYTPNGLFGSIGLMAVHSAAGNGSLTKTAARSAFKSVTLDEVA
jgi:hypothetical protein